MNFHVCYFFILWAIHFRPSEQVEYFRGQALLRTDRFSADHADHQILEEVDSIEDPSMLLQLLAQFKSSPHPSFDEHVRGVLARMRTVLETRRAVLWSQLKAKRARLKECKSARPEVLLEAELSSLGELGSLASTHRSCRQQEDAARSASLGCEDAYAADQEVAYKCLQEQSNSCAQELLQVGHRQGVCEGLKQAHEKQRLKCHEAQGLLEELACQEVHRSAACDSYSACHEQHLKHFRQAKDDIALEEATLKEHELALGQLECILREGLGSFAKCSEGQPVSPQAVAVDPEGKLFHTLRPVSHSASVLEIGEPQASSCMRSKEVHQLLDSFYVGLPSAAPAEAAINCSAMSRQPAMLMALDESELSDDGVDPAPNGFLAGMPIYGLKSQTEDKTGLATAFNYVDDKVVHSMDAQKSSKGALTPQQQTLTAASSNHDDATATYQTASALVAAATQQDDQGIAGAQQDASIAGPQQEITAIDAAASHDEKPLVAVLSGSQEASVADAASTQQQTSLADVTAIKHERSAADFGVITKATGPASTSQDASTGGTPVTEQEVLSAAAAANQEQTSANGSVFARSAGTAATQQEARTAETTATQQKAVEAWTSHQDAHAGETAIFQGNANTKAGARADSNAAGRAAVKNNSATAGVGGTQQEASTAETIATQQKASAALASQQDAGTGETAIIQPNATATDGVASQLDPSTAGTARLDSSTLAAAIKENAAITAAASTQQDATAAGAAATQLEASIVDATASKQKAHAIGESGIEQNASATSGTAMQHAERAIVAATTQQNASVAAAENAIRQLESSPAIRLHASTGGEVVTQSNANAAGTVASQLESTAVGIAAANQDAMKDARASDAAASKEEESVLVLRTVIAKVRLRGIDYNILLKDEELLAKLRAEVKAAFIANLPEGMGEDDVKLVLNPGVIVEAGILPPRKLGADAIQSKLESLDEKGISPLAESIKQSIRKLPKVESIMSSSLLEAILEGVRQRTVQVPLSLASDMSQPCAVRDNAHTPAPSTTTSPKVARAAPRPDVPMSMPQKIIGGRENWIIKLPDHWTNAEIRALAKMFSSKDVYTGHPTDGGLSVLIVWAEQAEMSAVVSSLSETAGSVYVERDSEIFVVETVLSEKEIENPGYRNAPSWGLDRIDQKSMSYDGMYLAGDADGGKGVHVYVMDTGVRTSHGQFGGRSVPTIEIVNGKLKQCVSTDTKCASDDHGHGTHVAGTIGGSTTGVAQGSWLHAVKILQNEGKGQLAYFVMALDWILLNAERPAVISACFLSKLRPEDSRILQDGIDKAISKGITVVVEASNDGGDACLKFPASVTSAITVAASTEKDQRAANSNYGTCVDLFAPGANIKSASKNSDINIAMISGTSMAAAHVAGAAALILGIYNTSSPENVASQIRKMSYHGILTGDLRGSPNLLLGVTNELGLQAVDIGPSDPIASGESMASSGPHARSGQKFRKKCVHVPKVGGRWRCAENAGDYGHRLGADRFKDSFKITVEGDFVCAERIDNSEDDFLEGRYSSGLYDEGGWILNLTIMCHWKTDALSTRTWKFQQVGDKHADSICSGDDSTDRKSLYYSLYKDVHSNDACEELCAVSPGCTGISVLPGGKCEVWNKNINATLRFPNGTGTGKCWKLLGRGQAGSGSLRLASNPQRCLEPKTVRTHNTSKVTVPRTVLSMSACNDTNQFQRFVWDGVGKMSLQVDPQKCLASFDMKNKTAWGDRKVVEVVDCDAASSLQLFSFLGFGLLRWVGKSQDWCLDAKDSHNDSVIELANSCDESSPSMQFSLPRSRVG